MKCRLCHELMTIDHPENVYLENPETFRKAWMHLYCFQNAFDELKNIKSTNPMYENRLDEYIQKFY